MQRGPLEVSKRVRSIYRRLCAFHFFNDVVLVYPIYTIMFADAGLSGSQIAIVLSSYSVAMIICEIPSGILADRFARHRIIYGSQVLKILGLILWLAAPTFYGFTIGMVVWAVAVALRSGTVDSYVYDMLLGEKKDYLYEKYTGKIGMYALFGMVGAASLATLFSSQSYFFLLLLSALAVLVSLCIGFTLPDVPRILTTRSNVDVQKMQITPHGAVAITHSITVRLRTWFSEMRTVFRSPSLRVIFLVATLATGFAGAFDEYYALVLERIETLPHHWIAAFVGLQMLAIAFANAIAYRFKSESPRRPALLLTCMGVLLAATTFVPGWFVVVFVTIASMLLTIMDVLHDGMVLRLVPPHVRSTVSSIRSMGVEVGVLPGLALLGGVIDRYGVTMAVTTLGLVVVLFGLSYGLYSVWRPQIV